MAENRIENSESLTNAVVATTRKFGSNPWWRGHSVLTWKLHPSVFREDRGGQLYEKNIAQRFMQKAQSRYPNCPNLNDAPNWLFLMQHYGLPTRLLDWTGSILIATYFAVHNEEYYDEDGVVWALMGTILNEDQAGRNAFVSTAIPPASTLFREALGGAVREPPNCIVATTSDETDLRMMVQLSEFTLHGAPTPIEELPNKEKFLIPFIIPKAAKSGLKELLSLFGITRSALFPDLENLAADLRSFRFKQ